MDDVYQPVNLIETYHPPEVDVPDEQAPETPTATQPIYEPEDDVVNRSAIPPANTATKTTTNVTSGNKPKVDPKTGTNGAKTIEDITVKSPQLVEGIGNADLIDAYNAGLNGTDLSRETRANAAAGNYSEQIEAMYNAGQQDSNGSMTDEDQDVSAAEKKSGYQSEVDNLENLGYTAGETTESNSVKVNPTDVTIPNMGAAPNADTAGSGNNTNSGNATSGSNTNNNSTQQYQISDSEKELNYMMDMLFMNGAGSSTDPSVQMAYQWVSNPDNKDKAIPQEVSDAFYAFMGGINDDQIAKSNQIAVGKDDEIGLVWKIYESKPKTTTNPDTNPTAPVSTSLGDYVTSTNQDKQSSYSWGQAGRFALGETLKSNPDIFGERSSVLYEAYQAGLNSIDLTEELVADARAGGFLDEIEAMHQAGETDEKIAQGDVAVDEEIPYMGYTQYGQGETAQTSTTSTGSNKITQTTDTGTGNSKTGNTSLGEAGNEVLDEIQDSDPTVFFKRYDALVAAYNAGYNGMDLTKEMLSDPIAGEYLEKFYLAGKIDSRTEEGKKELEEWEINTLVNSFNWTADADYYTKVLDALGADSNDLNVQKLYEYLNNLDKKEKISDDIKYAFCSYLSAFNDSIDEKIREYEEENGIELEGLYEGDIIPTGPYAGCKVTQGFNDPTDNQGHMAYDILGEYGSNIYPILEGKIVYYTDSNTSGNGRTIVIEHESPDGTKFYSSYSHLSALGDQETEVKLYVGMEVTPDTIIGGMGGSANGEDNCFSTHLHLMVYTIDTDNPDGKSYLKSPRGYASGETKYINGNECHILNFEEAGCIYGQYWCMTPNYEIESNELYRYVMFFDPLIVMQTNGEIIDLIWKITEKEN